uniref:Regulator of G protein signaling 1 n=1 Tax=Bos mutus grunniens TaxID=30521 RepID=A0A8B9WMT7_BOSMU
MRAAAISTPRLDKMPGMFLSANPKELKGTDHSLLDDKTQKKRPKTFGMDVKAYLRSMIPHLESGMKPSKSKDLSILTSALENLQQRRLKHQHPRLLTKPKKSYILLWKRTHIPGSSNQIYT